MKHPGVILRKLRQLHGYSMKFAAQKINRSVGWLSEVENQLGNSRIDETEYERILFIYEADKHQKLIHSWLSHVNSEKAKKREISYDGAILKYLRIKAGKTLKEIAPQVECSASYLVRIERGLAAITQTRRNQLINLYGYSTESFKNFHSREKRGLNVPALFKLNILLKTFEEEKILAVFDYAVSLQQKNKETNSEIL